MITFALEIDLRVLGDIVVDAFSVAWAQSAMNFAIIRLRFLISAAMG